MSGTDTEWERQRRELLGRRISELRLRVQGSKVERWVAQLYGELEARGLVFRPPVYLTDEWGCPEGLPLIGVPFFYADPGLERLEREFALELEEEADPMKILRHEAGHAFNYAYHLYRRADWHDTFGPYSRPYRHRFRVNPFSREHVRHILGWYAQKHPDEDFAESFAVWLTPGLDWRSRYRGWPALRKLEYIDAVMAEVGGDPPPVTASPGPEHLSVDAMRYTVQEHYQASEEPLPVEQPDHFDGDLRSIFAEAETAPDAPTAAEFLRAHRREMVGRIAYWTGETTAAIRAFVDHLTERAELLELRAPGREASLLIELVAFGTAVMMNYRHTDVLERAGHGG